MKLGSQYLGNGQCQFTVWAPQREAVAVHLLAPDDASPPSLNDRLIPMHKTDRGYWQVTTAAEPGMLYRYQLDRDRERPDPASQWQPYGVHGPSCIVDPNAFTWQAADWRGIPLAQMVIYELHVGTFTPEGTFTAIIDRLPDLLDLGINAIELMPVAQYPGDNSATPLAYRNWGYDGVYPYAVQNSYGGPTGLKTLVNACHQAGIAVILDVVYNHLGPEGNYLWDYGPYFTDQYHTPWGKAINFDGADSDEVRQYFLGNALYWLQDFHIDALRLDAVHAIYDFSARPFLQELADCVAVLSAQTYKRYLIAESDLNDTRVIRPKALGGWGHDAQWCDDFHHALHTLLTGEQSGYYRDFGTIAHLAQAYRRGYVYAGEYSAYRRRRHGNDPSDCRAEQFVVCCQNHDQVGNRLAGERLSHLVDFERLKLAAGALLLSPFVPMLFMGEEYGETAPFLYFVSHGDANLIEAVRCGRAEEFKSFNWEGEVPDPQGVEVFQRSKLDWTRSRQGKQGILRSFYQRLIQLRRTLPALATLDTHAQTVMTLRDQPGLWLHRQGEANQVLIFMNFAPETLTFTAAWPTGSWQGILDSAHPQWAGPGAIAPATLQGEATVSLPAYSVMLYQS
ncbi:malto-oligosyltrehalose trehalohydrolase [Trichothermofontia sp.]